MTEKFTPIKWPQDILRVPNGGGLMPPLDLDNRVNVRREGYSIPVVITPVSYGQQRTTTVEVGDDGDFWCAGIGLETVITATGVFDDNVWSTLQIQDIRPGFNLFEPYVRTDYFRNTRVGDYTPLIQPYCFTRTGAIQVTWTIDAKAVGARDHTLYLNFYGWKEYQDASR